MSDWNVYRHDTCHGQHANKTRHLVAEPTGDGWTAVYRRERGRYPNAIIGLTTAEITVADLERIGDRQQNEDREQFEVRVRRDLTLIHHHDPSLPPPDACINTPFPPSPAR
jgi:hypothetical protein